MMLPEPVLNEIERLWPSIRAEAASFVQPWPLIQIAVIALCFAVASLARRRLEPAIEARVRRLSKVPKSRLRMLSLVVRRLRGIFFILLAWLSVVAIRMVTWPSHSHLVALVATLATAWVFVGFSSRLIRNRVLRTIVSWGAWAYVTVELLGLTERVSEILDSIAIRFGDVHLSLLAVLKAAIIIALLIAIAGALSNAVGRRLSQVEDISPSMKVLTDKAIRLGLYGAAIIIGLQGIGFDLTSITVLSGAIGVGLGFGLQKVVSNLVSGIILLLDKSIKPGDVISLGETFGWISELGARYVSVVTRDGREYLIPNEDLITGRVVNWSHTNDLVRLDLDFGVSYDSDPHRVRVLAVDAALRVTRVVRRPEPVCHIVGFGDSLVDFLLRFWIRDPAAGLTNIKGDVYLALWDALKAAEIEIPFPQRDLHSKSGPGSAGDRSSEVAQPR